MNQLVRWIDEQIDLHQTEIARLMVARGVVEQAEAAVQSKPKAEKPVKGKKTRPPRGETKQLIIKAMLELGRPASSQEIFKQIGGGLSTKRIWSALYMMKSTGEVMRDTNGSYYVGFPSKPAVVVNRGESGWQ